MESPTYPSPDPEGEKVLTDYEQAVNAGDTSKSDEVAVQFFAHASNHAKQRPSRWLDCANRANLAMSTANWSDAERWYREALAAAIEKEGLSISKAYGDLSKFLSFVGRDSEALAAAEAGVESVLKLDIIPVVAMALATKTAVLVKLRRYAEAIEIVEQSLQYIPDRPVLALMRCRAIVQRAGCFVELGQHQDAQKDLVTAWPVLSDQANSAISAGGRSGLASWYRIEAKIFASQSDFTKAAESMSYAVHHMRAVNAMSQMASPYTQTGLAESLEAYANILRLAEMDSMADAAALESRQILEAIGL
jgi:tetratricopeptide (TPR) repeat protein